MFETIINQKKTITMKILKTIYCITNSPQQKTDSPNTLN